MKKDKFVNLILAYFLIIFIFLPVIHSPSSNFLPLWSKITITNEIPKHKLELETSALGWPMTEVVSTESTGNSYHPSIAVDGTGNVHVAWEDWTDYGGSGTDNDIFYKCWNATTGTWKTIEVVSTESMGDSYSPTIAADGFGNVHVAWYDLSDYGGSGTDWDIFYKRWNATTGTWSGFINTTDVISTESTDLSRKPSLAVDSSGNVHVAWEDCTDYGGSGTDNDIFYKCWNTSTSSWTTTVLISTESTGNSYNPSIAVDGSENVHVAWYDLTDYGGSGTDKDIFYKRWNATGIWSGFINTTDIVSTESSNDSWLLAIAVDGSGNVYVAWCDLTDYGGSGTDPDIFYKCWNTTTGIWNTTEVVSTESTGISFHPTIAVDGSGNVHVAWMDYTDYEGAGTDRDIFYKRRNAITGIWSGYVNASDVVSTESTGQFYNSSPTIAVDTTGNVHVAWDDSTNYGGSGTDHDIFYKHQINIANNYSDDFNSGTLDPKWIWHDGGEGESWNLTVNPGNLRIISTSKINAWWGNNGDNIIYMPYIYQNFSNIQYFEIITKVNPPDGNGKGNGIVLYEDDNNYIVLNNYRDSVGNILYAQYRSVGDPLTNIGVIRTTVNYFKLMRIGNLISYQYSNDGSSWNILANYTHNYNFIRMGIFCSSVGGGIFNSDFDFFNFTELAPSMPPPDPNTKTPLWKYDTGSSIYSVAITPNGQYIAVGTGNSLHFWDINSSTPLWSYYVGDVVQAVDMSEDGNYIVAGTGVLDQPGNVVLWQRSSSTPIWNYTGSGNFGSIAISADGNYIVAGDRLSNNLHLWHRDNSTPLWSFNPGSGNWESVAISSDGYYIVASDGFYHDYVYYFDRTSSTPMWNYQCGSDVWSVDISKDGQYYAAGSKDHKIYFWQNNSDTPVWDYSTSGEVFSVSISNDGSHIAAGSVDNNLYYFKTDNSTPQWSYTTGDDICSERTVSISGDGEYIAAGTKDSKIYFFYRNDSTPIWNFTTITGSIGAIDLSDTGQYLVAGGQDHYVYVFSQDNEMPPTSNHPLDIITTVSGTETINWTLYDDSGPGQYRIWVNDTNNNYYIWIDWTPWINNTNLIVPINRSTVGVFNYTIEYNNSNGTFGIPDIVIVKIEISVFNWTMTEVISTESTEDSSQPAIAVDNLGNVHVVWNDWTDYGGSDMDCDVFYKRWNAITSNWTLTEVVSTESTLDVWNLSIVADSSGNLHVVWSDWTDYGGSGTDNDIFYKFWNATSGTWSGYINATDVVSTESTGSSRDPAIAVDGSGNVHVVWTEWSNGDIFYKFWNSTSKTWNGNINATDVVSTEGTGQSWYPSIDVDGSGNVHVVWEDSSDYGDSGTDDDIFYKFWNVTSRIWSGNINTTDIVSTESTGGSWYPSIAVDSSGNVHVVWSDWTDYGGAGLKNDIFYKFWNVTSGTWGGNFNATDVVSTESTESSYSPSIFVDSFNNLHVVWEDHTDYGMSGTDNDIFYKLRNAPSGIWSGTVNITDIISTESTGSSWNPSIVVDGSGNIHVTWDDMTNYNGSGIDRDIFYKKKTITELPSPPTSNHPADIITPLSGTDTINWTLYDDFGPGQYRVWVNDTNNNYYIWVDWTIWTNNTNLAIPINRTAIGVFNYTIEYNNSIGLFGIPDTVLVFINLPAQSNSIIYGLNSSIGYNYHAIRIDLGDIIVENTLNLTPGKLNGTPVINSTILENSNVIYESFLDNINLFGNAKLTMRNIFETGLNIYLFNNSELILENCTLNSITACDTSKVWIKNTTINYIYDYINWSFPIIFDPSPDSSTIYVLQKSTISQVHLSGGSNFVVENSTIDWMTMQSLANIISGISRISLQATITNSTLNYLRLYRDSKATVFSSQLITAYVYDIAKLSLVASTITNLYYGIICNSGFTSIVDGVPSGGYINNTQLIGTSPSGSFELISVAVTGSASAYIEGWLTTTSFDLYLYDSSLAQLNYTFDANLICSYNNSQLDIENSIITTIMAYLNSSVTIQKNCSIGYMTIWGTGAISIDNSTINDIYTAQSLTSSPVGNILITNSTISWASISGEFIATFINCIINSLVEGIVVYDGTVIIDSTGISGSGSYTNYTQIISSTVFSRSLMLIEVNNTANVIINEGWYGNIYLMHDASATLTNANIAGIALFNNSNAFIHNSTINGTLFGLMSLGSSYFSIDQNSTLSMMFCTASSNGTMTNSTVLSRLILANSATLTILKSTILGVAKIMGSNSIDYSLKMYNSSIDVLEGIIWDYLLFYVTIKPSIILNSPQNQTVIKKPAYIDLKISDDDLDPSTVEWIANVTQLTWTNSFIGSYDIDLSSFASDQTVQFWVRANDTLDNQNLITFILTFDDIPPTKPSNLTAIIQKGNITISWNSSSDFNAIYYHIWRHSKRVSKYLGNTTSNFYIDLESLKPGKYTYEIIPFDEANNTGESINITVKIRGRDIYYPFLEPPKDNITFIIFVIIGSIAVTTSVAIVYRKYKGSEKKPKKIGKETGPKRKKRKKWKGKMAFKVDYIGISDLSVELKLRNLTKSPIPLDSIEDENIREFYSQEFNILSVDEINRILKMQIPDISDKIEILDELARLSPEERKDLIESLEKLNRSRLNSEFQ